MDEDIYPDELYHYGRKGMKWGQHIFGKERPAGGNRKKKSEDVADRFVSGAKSVASKVSASQAKAKEDKRVQKLKKKKISDMTDDELAEYTDRMNRERAAALAKQQVTQMNPQKVAKGSSFISSIGKNVISPAAQNVGRQYLEKVLRDVMGLNEKPKDDPLKNLRDEVDKLNLESKKATYKNNISKQNAERKDRKRDRAKAKAQREADEAAENHDGSDATQNRNSSNRDRNTVDVSPETVSSGYSYIESNRQLLNTPIAGLLPAPKDDRYR